MSTPFFIRNESGFVRVRESEKIKIVTDVSKTAGCYRVENKWAWRIRVDQQLMRGSGRMFPNAFARELGCELGDKIKVDSAFGYVTVSWPTNSASGASLGSIRFALEQLGAAVGDYLFIIADSFQIQFRLLRQKQLVEERSIAKLARLVGVVNPKESDDVLTQIADALEVDDQLSEPLEQQIRDVLLSRGEDDLYELIQPPKLSMDQYLDRIGDVLGDTYTSD